MKDDYTEHITTVCNETDFGNKENALETAKYLASELANMYEFLVWHGEWMLEHLKAGDYVCMEADYKAHKLKERAETLPEGDLKEYIMQRINDFEACEG